MAPTVAMLPSWSTKMLPQVVNACMPWEKVLLVKVCPPAPCSTVALPDPKVCANVPEASVLLVITLPPVWRASALPVPGASKLPTKATMPSPSTPFVVIMPPVCSAVAEPAKLDLAKTPSDESPFTVTDPPSMLAVAEPAVATRATIPCASAPLVTIVPKELASTAPTPLPSA